MKKSIAFIFLIMLILSGCGVESLPDIDTYGYIEKSGLDNNQYDTLCVPTQMTKLFDSYYIVDCYHNQVLVSDNPDKSLTEWSVLSDRLSMGHTIASDGVVYLIDDTENNSILVYAKAGEDYYLTQTINDIGKRPHFISYDEKRKTFYALSSLTGEFYLFKRVKDSYEVELSLVKQIPQLADTYVRSFSFIEGDIYLPAGNGFIYKIDPDSFEIKGFWPLAPEIGGPVQLVKIKDYYYLTVSTDIIGDGKGATIVRAKSLDSFGDSTYESIKDSFCTDGTPYVITEIDGSYYLAWHSDNGANCMWSFKIDKDNIITEITRVFE